MTGEQDILVERIGAVARVTLNRPAQMNAFTPQMMLDLPGLIQAEIDSGARAVILTGAGDNFCAGANIAPTGQAPATGGAVDVRGQMDDCYNPLARFFAALPVPLITAVKGAAAGGGASLALSGDIVVVGRSAYVMLAFALRGLVPDVGATWLVASAVGRLRALKMALLAEKMFAPEALAAGLVSEVVDDDLVLARAEEIATRLAAMPTKTLAAIRSQVQVAIDQGFEASLDAERDNQVMVSLTRDYREGINAFKEKRRPVFTGE
ncbi:enoyl-CoA hydratase-related protein [Novosphingobium sp. PS1R-30]|uniref:Enoyl-CoA hydratase-related protein n=1 Tax=Novosphingobium anseongense TaxID=3133436 RepID=A0ABU8RYR3_9SPHN